MRAWVPETLHRGVIDHIERAHGGSIAGSPGSTEVHHRWPQTAKKAPAKKASPPVKSSASKKAAPAEESCAGEEGVPKKPRSRLHEGHVRHQGIAAKKAAKAP